MSGIETYRVIEPPTSEGVRKRVAEAFSTNGLLRMTLLSDREVPRPGPLDVVVTVRRTIHPETGGMVINGDGPGIDFIKVQLDLDETQPATASVVAGTEQV
jgi:hypothetical protein